MLNGKTRQKVDNPALGMRAGEIASARTLDADILRQFYHDPDIWGPMQCDDGLNADDLDFDQILEDDSDNCHIFVTSHLDNALAALFMFAMENSRCYSIHSALLQKYWGKGYAAAFGQSACRWMFNNTSCLKIITLVPDYNISALEMSMSGGMIIEGVNRKSFMKGGILYDQTMLGITREELLCQSQQF